jgi:hypothetical protein
MYTKSIHVLEIMQKKKWELLFFFLISFSLFYFMGDYMKHFGSDWMWSEEFEIEYRNETNMKRLYFIFSMIKNGAFLRLYETFYLLSPILFSMLCTLMIINLKFAVEMEKREGKKKIASYLLEFIIASSIFGLFYMLFLMH